MKPQIKMIMLQDSASRKAGEEFTVSAEQQADYFEGQGIAQRVSETDTEEAASAATQDEVKPDGAKKEDVKETPPETQTTHVKKTRSKKS